MTLVEMMVATAMTALLMLALGQFAFNSARTRKSDELSREFNDVANLVGQTLGQQSSCTSALQGLPVSMASSVPSPIPTLVANTQVTGSPAIVTNNYTFPSGLKITGLSDFAASGVLATNTAQGIKEYLVNFTLTAQKTGTATVNKTFVGNNYFTKTYTVSAWLNSTNNITTCAASQGAASLSGAGGLTQVGGGVECTVNAGPPPTCPGGAPATCCNGIYEQFPFYYCPTAQLTASGWKCL
jgi:type II secretory pathway pseudopilin PulG